MRGFFLAPNREGNYGQQADFLIFLIIKFILLSFLLTLLIYCRIVVCVW